MKTKVDANPERITFDNKGEAWFKLTRDGRKVIADSFCEVEIDEAAQERLIEWLRRKGPKS